MIDGHELYNELRQFMGGEQPYQHALVKSFHYTEGVRFFAQNAGGGAYWMLDTIAFEPHIAKHIRDEGFALVTLKVTGSRVHLQAVNDTGEPPIYEEWILYTDCPEAPVTTHNPEGVWKFYIEQTMIGDKVVPIMLLPNER